MISWKRSVVVGEHVSMLFLKEDKNASFSSEIPVEDLPSKWLDTEIISMMYESLQQNWAVVFLNQETVILQTNFYCSISFPSFPHWRLPPLWFFLWVPFFWDVCCGCFPMSACQPQNKIKNAALKGWHNYHWWFASAFPSILSPFLKFWLDFCSF